MVRLRERMGGYRTAGAAPCGRVDRQEDGLLLRTTHLRGHIACIFGHRQLALGHHFELAGTDCPGLCLLLPRKDMATTGEEAFRAGA